MNMIIPWDLFFWFASPIDFDNLWKKFDHKKNLEEWFDYYIEKGPRGYYLYRSYVKFIKKEDGSYEQHSFTFLMGVGEKEFCQFEIDSDKEHFLEDPEYMYSFVGLI